MNHVRLVTSHLNGGHYAVASDMALVACLSEYNEWVVAGSQAEADQIVSSRSYLIPSPNTLGVDILEPAGGQEVFLGVPVQVTAGRLPLYIRLWRRLRRAQRQRDGDLHGAR